MGFAETHVKIYTDGACSGNPGVGGWAFFAAGVGCWSGSKAETTNNEMELKAIYEAIRWAYGQGYQSVTLYTDSAYCMNGYKDWMYDWKLRGWKASTGKTIKNKNLWVDLYNLSTHITVGFVKVKGHSGNVGNDYVDAKAVAAMNKLKNRLQSV